jgi:hypothetical protein
MDARPVTGPGWLLGLVLALAAGTAALAADPVPAGAAPAYERPQRPVSFISEARHRRLGARPLEPGRRLGEPHRRDPLRQTFHAGDLFTSYFVPRPHIGGSLNFDDKTSFAYAGLTWTVDITPRFFVEGSFGGASITATPAGWFRPGATGSAARPCSRVGLGRRAAQRQLEHHGDRRAYVERRPLRAEPRPDQYRRAAGLHLLGAFTSW